MFGAAIVTLIILTNVLVAIAFGFTGTQAGMTFDQALAAMPADSWLWISIGVVGVVGTASVYKYLSLQAGGRTIAEALGGSLIHQNTQDPKQRRLLNVVEEMAIASGMPVPPVYLIPEPSINAFAAGFGTDDAVIGINQGTLDLLDRTELQGVVAHEFSHILNGDTNINLRLIAILHGILFIGMIGYGLARAGGYSRKNGMPLVALGVGLLIVGYGGTFFGNMIKAAVSRQREYLADASAVQFTRDPNGIADALKKIGGHTMGSTMTSSAAEEASHMFFGAAAKKFAGNIMATHPPLDQRILAIEPNWNGKFTTPTGVTADHSSFRHRQSATAQAAAAAPFAGAVPVSQAAAPMQVQAAPDDIIEQVGTISDDSIVVAKRLINEQSDNLADAAHDPFEARALVYAMLIATDEHIAQQQLAFIAEQAEAGVPPHVTRLLPNVRNTDRAHLLTLLDMSMPALKELSYAQYKRFSRNAASLITADATVDVFEWVLHRLLTKELYPQFEGPQNYHGRISSIAKVADDAAKLLSILASHAHDDVQEQLKAYRVGAEQLGLDHPFAKQDRFDYQRMNAALGNLRKLKPLVKPTLLKACAATVLADGEVSADEGALLQGVAATLDCPIPPSIYRQTAA